MTEWYEFIALVIGGFAAGLINVVAGNGSAITLPLLMSLGLDANAANATNRIGALFQTTSAISSLSRTARTKYMIRQSYFIIPPVLIGAIIGANLAVDLPEDFMRITIGSIMILLLITTLTNPKKWLIPTDGSKN
ncbi:sulfite exporter TauE/SafE family protein, partial [Schleiferiaceae bacterium]|nr:sulfite exporter TauE/SafE family protein [Schleiferiaceae bacterium]